jgi:choline dehydrogenase
MDSALNPIASSGSLNGQRLMHPPDFAPIRSAFDFIVCGAGSSGSVVAGRLSENPAVDVLLLEAGGDDSAPAVTEAANWMSNIGSERDWCFRADPNPQLNGRALHLAMGKGLGGGSSMNGMMWSRGHRNDWEFLASETGDPSWSYESILKLYRRAEDWHGAPDSRRGVRGPVFVQPLPDPHPIVLAFERAAGSCGVPSYEDANGAMMESEGGCALLNLTMREGKRTSIFRAYSGCAEGRPNLKVITGALVTRMSLQRGRATGVEFLFGGRLHHVDAGSQIVLSLGAVNTPKLLMQSGIGDEAELKRHGIRTLQHLPGVGRNFHDHFTVAGCVWRSKEPLPFGANGGGASLFWKSNPAFDAPDLHLIQALIPYMSEDVHPAEPPPHMWSILPGVVRPASRGRIRLNGPSPSDGVGIDAGFLNEPTDMTAALRCLAFSSEIGNASAMKDFSGPQILPGRLSGKELENFVRNAIMPQWHPVGTARMGRDALSVVDNRLRLRGVGGLTIADASVFPRVPIGNTMAPCVIVGERASDILKAAHGV